MAPCNTTLEDLLTSTEEYSFGLTFHQLSEAIAACFGLVAIIIAVCLIILHATHYARPHEQRHIIRILFLIPVYAFVSYLSLRYYRHAIYFETIRDCYEAIAIASFFALLCSYIAPSLHDQKEYFRSRPVRNWVWPIPWLQKCTGGQDRGLFRKPRSALTSFNLIWVGVFQYCFIRVFFTFVALITQALGRYCTYSNSPEFAHVWVEVFEALGVTLAMYTLIQFYAQIRDDISSHRPFLKLLSIKLVIFFSFWQSLVISFSITHGRLGPTKYLAYPDLLYGIPNMLLCVEMFLFAILHIFSFSWRPYGKFNGIKPEYYGGFLGVYAFIDAFNPWDIVKASARGARWMFVGRRTRMQDISYQQHAAEAHISYNSTKLQPLGATPMPLDRAPPSYSSNPGKPGFAADNGDLGAGAGAALYPGSRNDPFDDTTYHGASPYDQPYGSSNRSPSPYDNPFDERNASAPYGPPEDRAGLLSNASRTAQHPVYGNDLDEDVDRQREAERDGRMQNKGRHPQAPGGSGWV